MMTVAHLPTFALFCGADLLFQGYEITHVQDPLDEVVYHVNNLATDLRDGVLLCRLVEILLHGSSTTLLSGHNISEDTMTIRMPDETMLVTDIGMLSVSPRPMRTLSQHLKIPCIGHAQRAYNVQIALSALESHSVDASNVVGSIQAEDVVKGHRERTLSLLWSLISVYGLEYLVDFDHLAASVPSSPDRAQMLQSWAALHAQKSGIKVDNLTGSFVDGRVYQAILEGFSTCVGQSGTIQDRLQTIGCSKAFTEKLTSAIGVVPSRETTLSNLAFLASRLLPLQRQYDAAAVIQRAFRHHRARGIASQRIRLLRLAHDCAQVALARARVTAAATVVQRAWRRVLDHRIERLDRDVMAFQVVARGWAVRRRGRLTRW
jgi:abnormal spindle-like microcephaly-associated protein